MIWTRAEAYNFLAFKEIKLDLDNRGLVLIEGKNLSSNKFESNGAGKTSIIDIIVYVLYDTTTKGLKADEVINRHAKKNTCAVLEGRKREDTYRIERYRKHKKYGSKVRLIINGEDETASSVKETNKKIEQLIGLDYLTFTNSIMFSQRNQVGRFSTATDKEKKEILENLVNLTVYGTAQDIAKKRVKDKDAEIEQKKREEEKLQWELTQVDSFEQQDQERYNSTKQAIEQEQQNFENVKEAMNKHITDNQHNVTTWINEVEKLKEQQEQLNSPTNPHSETVNQLTHQLNELKAEQQRLTIEQNEEVKKYKQLGLQDTCPVCGNELDTAHRDKEQEVIKGKLREIITQLNVINPAAETVQQKYNDAYALYLEVKKQQDGIVTLHRDLSTKIGQINSLQQQYSNQLESYKSKLSAITSTLNRLNSFPEPVSRDADRLAIKDKINAHREAMVALQKEKNILEDTVKIFSNSGVKSHVLDLVTPFLNERANKYLGALAGSDMELIFSTQTRKKDGEMSEKFDVQLHNAVGGESYKANSDGEMKRADLAIAHALQDYVITKGSSPVNFLLYDEILDGLDEVGVESVVQLLKEKQKQIGTVLVITHSSALKAMFEKVFTVVKNKDGIATLEEGANIT
ncbi:exonuclease [Bacillus phage Moonbeam]|uniref:Nucleoside triphosphate hydrolase n=1 Tax=Bacillus phage Moonbeam TaxID=1540091 RepID=A0A0A0RPH3_9CAUD|nr:exonuclease [Bacillus phage Moonbeam]AIW03494.1 nucleoside triphosphate hydrolase [Bacillus phage Moonbeam]